jgi:peptide deformylase
MKLTFCYYGNPILRKKGEPITEITDEIRDLAISMIDYFDNNNGIGLSAQQVGKALKLFVLRRYIHLPDGRWTTSEPHVYINPKIVARSKETWVEDECCMSLPKLYLPVERPLKIKIESTNLEGNRIVEEVEGINARVIMHENDHINGVLFIDRVEDKYLKLAEGKLREIKKKYN